LFKQWEIFAGMHKFKNDTQKEQIWNVWQNKIKNRAAEGWFGKETDFDPTDPKWRKAIGLTAEETSGTGEPKTKTDFANTLRRLQTEDYEKAKKYYDKYLDKFY